MDAKEKAKELFEKYLKIQTNVDYRINNWELAKYSSLICVDEIIDAIDWHSFEVPNAQFEYWGQVKEEINKSNYIPINPTK